VIGKRPGYRANGADAFVMVNALPRRFGSET
jgi:hypothetical protein